MGNHASCTVLGAALAIAAISPSASFAGDINFSDLQFSAGGVGIITPKYEGSKSYNAYGVPFAFPGSKDGDDDLTFSDIDSIQYRFVKSGPFEAGILGGAWFGRSESDGDKLRGLGRIDSGLVVGGFGALHFGNTRFTASYHHQVTGTDVGGLVRLRADTELPVSPGFKFLAGVGTNYATDKYISTNFGVTAAQAATSLAGLPVYDASAGFKDVFVGAGFEADLTDRWTARLYGQYSRLVGDAGNSPVIETQDQFNGILSLTYQFGPLGSPAGVAAAAPLK